MVIKEEFNMLPWWQWPLEFREKDMNFLNEWVKKHYKSLLKKKLVQWHLDKQWSEIKNFAKSNGIKLTGQDYNYTQTFLK